MAETYSAGVVTAYGAAVRAGYTGTYEQFCSEQARFAENAAAVAQAKAAVETMQGQVEQTAATFTGTTVPAAVATVQEAGAAQVQAVQSEGTTQAQAVETVGAQQVAAVGAAGSDAVDAVEAAETAATGAVTAAQTAAVQAVQTESSTQQTAIQTKGAETIASIPADYTALSNEVDDLREASEVANWLVDYNYFDAAVESLGRYDYTKIGIDRKKTRFVFDCQYDLGYAVHAKLSNALERATSTSSAKEWDNGFDVKAGHLYHIIMRHISGSVTVAEGMSYPSIRVYTLGASFDTSVKHGYIDNDTYIVEYYADADATVNIVLYVTAHTQFDAYTVEIIMEDVTHAFAVDKRAVTSNVEYNTTASKSYAVGRYLIVGQTLYKVTAAIASGETIAPGTNVVETTVMNEIYNLINS